MCSSPKPKSKVKGKGGKSGSLLSTISPAARTRFAERANLAQERRHKLAMKIIKHEAQLATSFSRSNNKPPTKSQQSSKNVFYWLATASINDIFSMLFLGKSKPL